MNRPYVICHMVTSIDGKVTGDFLNSPSCVKACEIYLVMNYKKSYDAEAKQRFGETVAYKEHKEKTANYTKEKWQQVNEGLNSIFHKFAQHMKGGNAVSSDSVGALVKELQTYITENCYTCTNEILKGLGKMYVCDERFKNNIDKNGEGTAEFVAEAIKSYCKR